MNDLVEGQFLWSKVSVIQFGEAYTHNTANAAEIQITPWLTRNASKRDEVGNTLLHFMLWEQYQRIVGQLVASGVDIYVKTQTNRQNVLHLSAVYHLPACLTLFLGIGRRFNVNRRDLNGNTPLHLAADNVREGFACTCMNILLQHGADLNLLNGKNQTVLDILVSRRKFYQPISHDVLDDLVRQGAWFHRTKHANKKYPWLVHLRHSLARSRLASRATALALRHKKDVHKDVIPLIIQQIELLSEK